MNEPVVDHLIDRKIVDPTADLLVGDEELPPVHCEMGGARATQAASEIALALKSGKPVILLNERRECIDFFRAISGKLAHESNSVDDTISHVKKLLAKV